MQGLFLYDVEDIVNLTESILHRVIAVDSKVVVAMEIVGADRFGLCLIYLETLLDGLVVIVCTAAGFATVEEAFDHLILLYKEVEEHSFHLATLKQKL